MEKKDSLTAIDLFCGAGGLTLGLKRAKFNVIAGVEYSEDIARTYHANHRKTELFVDDIRNVHGEDILKRTGLSEIDLVAGCPPCQGFSKLTDKYHRIDPRNELIFQMDRIIKEIQPEMIMMENVPGLAARGKPVLDLFISSLESSGYVVNKDVLQLADYGIPQSRKRLVLLAGYGFKIPLPAPTHTFKPKPDSKLKPWLTLTDAIRGMDEPITISTSRGLGGPMKCNWHVVRDLKKISLDRLRAIKAGEDRRSLPQELRPNCHKDSDDGFLNAYGRLSWNQTPPTITGGFATPCKGRFGHPDQLRTISLREAAMIQTFPPKYKFKTDNFDEACNMVGNALPPEFARIVAKSCISAYKKELLTA